MLPVLPAEGEQLGEGFLLHPAGADVLQAAFAVSVRPPAGSAEGPIGARMCPMSGPATVPRTRDEAAKADQADPLARYRDNFVIAGQGPLYLDGNSLGRQPRGSREAMASLFEEWAGELVRAWERWAELPMVVGDRVGQLLGASPGQVVATDSTTVNLYKLALAALDARPGRDEVVGDANDFPTVRYVLQGIASRHDRRLQLVESDPAEGVGDELAAAVSEKTALVYLSAVNYRSGAVVDIAAVSDLAHKAGALTLFDLSHAAGVLPLQLERSGADLAVGCGYKYLNGGPGAPAWLYVRKDLQQDLRQPIWGWWGQREQFAMGPSYDPLPGIGRFLTGTPDVLGLTALDAGVRALLEAGMAQVWAKTQQLVALLGARSEELLAPLGARLASPSQALRRGGHLAVSHPHAQEATQLLAEKGLVLADFRQPDVMRLAPAALYTRYVDVWDAMDHIASALEDLAARARPRGGAWGARA
jgi:kynureninase